jgi:hypothetical protein
LTLLGRYGLYPVWAWATILKTKKPAKRERLAG